MQFVLREDLCFCQSAGSVVFLDIHTGRYSALPSHFVGAFSRWVDGSKPSNEDLQILERLAQHGILFKSDVLEQPRKTQAKALPSPEFELGINSPRPSFLLVIHAISARLLWAWRVHHQSFSKLIQKLEIIDRSRPRKIKHGSARTLDRLASAFQIADLLLGSHDRCLSRSLALVAVCRGYGLTPTLVIGIQALPFAAHCWVQDGNVIANESLDRAQMFTPILVA